MIPHVNKREEIPHVNKRELSSRNEPLAQVTGTTAAANPSSNTPRGIPSLSSQRTELQERREPLLAKNRHRSGGERKSEVHRFPLLSQHRDEVGRLVNEF